MTTPDQADDHQDFTVVINEEQQYSLWPLARPVPPGWRKVGVEGPRQSCLQHIESAWTDMRPASVRGA